MPVIRLMVCGLTLVLLCVVLSCKGSKPPAKPTASAIDAQDSAPTSKSETEALREDIKDYVTLLADCDRGFFADVKPERIDKWELPVNVVRMEKTCDMLLSRHDALFEKGAFRAPVLDDFLRLAASASDRYLLLAFRCKKVGVRDKEPYKQEVAQITANLRADVARLKDGVGIVLALPDEELSGRVSDDELIRRADGAFSRLREDMKQAVEESLKAKKPVWRNGLKASNVIATKALRSIRSHMLSQVYLDAAIALTNAFNELTIFYNGDYFEAEEKEGPRLRAAVVRADINYKNASRRAFKK